MAATNKKESRKTFAIPLTELQSNMFPPLISESTVSGGTTTKYEGWADEDASADDAFWAIRRTKTVVSGGVTTVTIAWSDSTNNFDKVWTNRASYNYAQ